MSREWERVTKAKPCKICQKIDWCTRSRETGAACCMRVESAKQCANGGWLHRGPSDGQRIEHPSKPEHPKRIDFAYLTQAYRAALNGHLADHAVHLGVTVASLDRLEAGWDGEALCFPMRDAAKRIVGIRRRIVAGGKNSVSGGHEGCFVPIGLGPDPLYICEGPTDTAAMLSIGLTAIGRPNCTGGTIIVAALVALRHVVIVADSDTPGLRGASALAKKLTPLCKSVDMIEPPDPYKDVRQWIQAGATKKDFSFASVH